MAGESRQELLHWLNSLLQLNVTKVEQCGTGAALCQIYDSIFLDVPMNRVKFNATTEYAYLANLKILQSTFSRHGIERTVPIESLVKCKMQDNLEFLQWTKRFWDQNWPGHDYDAVGRRKAAGQPGTVAAPVSSGRTSTASSRKPAAAPARVAPRAAAAVGVGAAGGAAAAALRAENETMKEAIAGLEKERDFYFSKLRDIELLLQTAIEQDPDIEKDDGSLVKQIQTILYSTEEGFEIPEGEEANGADEPETF